MDHEMGKHRRQFLSQVAQLYQTEKEEFYQKYRIFQLHKWEILKAIKKNMLQKKIREMEKKRWVKTWIVLMHVKQVVQKAF
jgi:SAM-dependent MidA family methyltransferase